MKKPPVLLVSSDKSVLSMAAPALKNEYALELATDPMIALRTLDAVFKFVLVEFDMPDRNGLEFLREIRMGRSAAKRNLPVGLLAHFADDPVFRAAISLDLNTLLMRPFSRADILRRATRLASEDFEPKPEADYAAVPIPLCDSQKAAKEERERALVAVRMPTLPRMAATDAKLSQWSKADATDRQFGPMVKRQLTEVDVGWQIGADVLSPSGTCLIAAGSILTKRLLGRLYDFAEKGVVFEIWARAPIAQNGRQRQGL